MKIKCYYCRKTFSIEPYRIVRDKHHFCSRKCKTLWQRGNRKYQNREWLRQEYVVKGKSSNRIGEECHVHGRTIRKWLNRFDLTAGKYNLWTDKTLEILKKKYPENGTDIPELKDRTGDSIYCKAKEMNLNYLYYSPRNKRVEITPELKAVIDGLLLGDGCIKAGGNNKTASLNVTQSCDHLEWLRFLKEFFIKRKLDGHISPHGKGGMKKFKVYISKDKFRENIYRVKPSYAFRSCYYLDLMDFRKRWYPNGKKVIPKDIDLSPILLIQWYISDGSYAKRDGTASFTNCLIFEEWKVLSKKISKVLDIDNGISINKQGKNNDGNQVYMLRLNKTVTRKFFDIVDSLGFDIPECYQYKFGKEIG